MIFPSSPQKSSETVIALKQRIYNLQQTGASVRFSHKLSHQVLSGLLGA
jgi:hypothetical protein